MASINLGYVQQIGQAVDNNRDGKLNPTEIAQASLNLMSQGDQTGASFFAALLQGGVDQKGYYPDFDQDGQLSMQDFATLAAQSGAAQSGDAGTIDSQDLQIGFGNRYQPGGSGQINVDALRQLAGPQYSDPYGQNGLEQQLASFLPRMMLMMMQIFSRFTPQQPQ